MNTLKIGIIQQANTADRTNNKQRLAQKIEELAKNGARLIVLQELHNGLYFCQTEEVSVFDQAESIPGESTEYFGAVARRYGVVLVLSLFERRMAGTTIRRSLSRKMALLQANIVRCISPMILPITRSIISLPGT